jgi:hypothetical protein
MRLHICSLSLIKGVTYIPNHKDFNGIGSSLTKISALILCAQDSRRRIKSMIERPYSLFFDQSD